MSLQDYFGDRYRGDDPRDLRAAALLIEADALAGEVRRLAAGAARVDTCLSVDRQTAYVTLTFEGAPSEHAPAEAARLRDTLRGLPGAPGLRRFLGLEEWGRKRK